MREPELLPDGYELKPGIAWYGGVQRRDNWIVEPPPPARYLCRVPDDAVRRARYAARIGMADPETNDLTVLFYVDPDTQHLYGQPHPNTKEATMRDWGIAAPHATLPFELARNVARWIYKASRSRLDAKLRRREDDFAAWWRGYMASPHAMEPPVPLGIPIDPSQTYRQQGWVDAKDWLKKPPKLSAKHDDEDDEAGEAVV